MQVEGIYRVNGNQADIGLIEQKVEESKYKTHCTNGAIYYMRVNPFTPGDFAKKRVLKLVEWFSGHCRAIKS